MNMAISHQHLYCLMHREKNYGARLEHLMATRCAARFHDQISSDEGVERFIVRDGSLAAGGWGGIRRSEVPSSKFQVESRGLKVKR